MKRGPGPAARSSVQRAPSQLQVSWRRSKSVDAPISSVEEAKAIAKVKLVELTLSYVTGEAEAIGRPDLRAGALATILGLGEQFNGQYHVSAVRRLGVLSPRGSP